MRENSRQAALVDTVNVTLACRRAGIPRRTAYDWREADEGFARKWDEAVDEGIDLLEVELRKRAFEGVERPVYYKGEQVGTWRFYSDALAMFLLKAHRPERYRGGLPSPRHWRLRRRSGRWQRGNSPRGARNPGRTHRPRWCQRIGSEGKEIQRATPAPCLGKLSG